MTPCTLKPANKRLKQLIKQHGNQWNILRQDGNVQCFKDTKFGYFIESLDKKHTRWVRQCDIT